MAAFVCRLFGQTCFCPNNRWPAPSASGIIKKTVLQQHLKSDGVVYDLKKSGGFMNKEMGKIEKFIKTRPKKKLKWTMILLLILCWVLPLTIIAYVMLYVTTNNINKQVERTIVTSADNAVRICETQMDAVVNASRNASYLRTVKNSWQQYKKDGNGVALYDSISSFLEQHYQYNRSLLNTVLFFPEKPEKLFYTNMTSTSYQNSLWIQENVIPIVSQRYRELDTDVDFINVQGHIYIIRNLMDSSYQPFAVLIMELDRNEIFGSLSSTWGYTASQIYLDGELIIEDTTGMVNADSGILEENNRSSRIYKDGDDFYVYTVRKPDRHYIGYITALDRRAIIDDAKMIEYVCFLFCLFMMPLFFIVFLFFHRKVTRPIEDLLKASHSIEEGKYGYQIEKRANSQEFAYLEDAFNSMSARLKYQFETIYSEELALKDARIMALQSQINPHFLNNTLEIINWEARINENYKVSRMIENLSIMLEATMDRRHRRFVTLAEEMSYVEAYLFIIAQRLGERLRIEKNVDETLFNVKVPRLIIQPIIENAVEHGINGQTHGSITINVFADGERLVIEVRNTGSMSREDEDKIELLLSDDYEPGEIGSASLGIRNVNRRIKIIYGDSCGLTVKNDENNETSSRIIVKLDYDNNKRQ